MTITNRTITKNTKNNNSTRDHHKGVSIAIVVDEFPTQNDDLNGDAPVPSTDWVNQLAHQAAAWIVPYWLLENNTYIICSYVCMYIYIYICRYR